MDFVYISVLNNHKNNFHINTGIIRSMVSLKVITNFNGFSRNKSCKYVQYDDLRKRFCLVH